MRIAASSSGGPPVPVDDGDAGEDEIRAAWLLHRFTSVVDGGGVVVARDVALEQVAVDRCRVAGCRVAVAATAGGQQADPVAGARTARRSVLIARSRSVPGKAITRLASGSPPPASAHGRDLVLLITERNSPSASNTMSRRRPQPPRNRPTPPESARISSRSKRMPLRASSTSIGVLRATVWHGWLRGPAPSWRWDRGSWRPGRRQHAIKTQFLALNATACRRVVRRGRRATIGPSQVEEDTSMPSYRSIPRVQCGER